MQLQLFRWQFYRDPIQLQARPLRAFARRRTHVFVIVAIARTALDRAAHAGRANFAQACQH
ncbi:hypothetical protein ACOTFR_17370 [Achromobacter xylosoxidans]